MIWYRHGHTVLVAVALTAKEGTADYEWQYECWLEAVGVPPQLIFTDADPGSTAAIAEKFPGALHLWCLWHILQNLKKNLLGKMGNEYSNFSKDFRNCQKHMSEQVFWKEYEVLRQQWPEAAPYLDTHLTPNVKYWGGFRYTRFSTGAVSTQRGEGLNRHFKAHLSGQSPLCKLFETVLLKEEREEARLIVSCAKDEVRVLLAISACPANPPHTTTMI